MVSTKNNKTGIVASILAVFGIGICCGLPLFTALLGVSSASLGFLAPLRKIPHFDTILGILSLSLLTYAHIINFRNKKKKEDDCCAVPSDTKTKKISNAVLWFATVLVLSLIIYNHVIFPISLRGGKAEVSESKSNQNIRARYKEYKVYVEGMDCAMCFQAVKRSIEKKVGEAGYELLPDFKNKVLIIKILGDEKSISQFISAIEDAGYRAKIVD
ncbi:hypothetical protein HRbin19_01251 [bacterium HR19]|nr:hypothetical protein HRbin19_01251 [bacterium HR19]